MFQRLILTDFQSHKHTELDFHANFNAVVGMSNVGKTAITRALEFILYGKWDSSWVRHGAKACKIELQLSNGIEVVREKGEKLNKYILRIPGSPEQVYEGFGTEVPEPISTALGVTKAVVDGDVLTLNLSSQHEPLFLFSKPGSFKAKLLGKLSGAHYLDYALKELNKERKNLSTEKTLKTKELEDLTKQETVLREVNQLQGPIKILELKESELRARLTRLNDLKSLFLAVQTWKQHYTRQTQIEAVLDQVALIDIDSTRERVVAVSGLRQVSDRLAGIEQQIIKLNSDIARLTSSETQIADEIVAKLEETKVCPTCFSNLDSEKLSKIRTNLCGEHAFSIPD